MDIEKKKEYGTRAMEERIKALRNGKRDGEREVEGYVGDERVRGYLEGNRKWTQSKDYQVPITFSEMQEKGRENEEGSVIVLACTDPRHTPEEYLRMSSKQNNKATIIRTAGARATPALSTLLILSAVGNRGKKGSIMIIGHTDCGLQSVDDGEIRRILAESIEGVEGSHAESVVGLEGMEFGSFRSPDESVSEDVEMLKRSPFFRGVGIEGFVQDFETGVVWGVEEWRREGKRDELVRVDEERGWLFDG